MIQYLAVLLLKCTGRRCNDKLHIVDGVNNRLYDKSTSNNTVAIIVITVEP